MLTAGLNISSLNNWILVFYWFIEFEIKDEKVNFYQHSQDLRPGGGLTLVFSVLLSKSDSEHLRMTNIGLSNLFHCIILGLNSVIFLSSVIRLDIVVMVCDFNIHVDEVSCPLLLIFIISLNLLILFNTCLVPHTLEVIPWTLFYAWFKYWFYLLWGAACYWPRTCFVQHVF